MTFSIVLDFHAHDGDVKSIAVNENEGKKYIASGSRDGIVKLWEFELGKNPTVPLLEHREQGGFVNAVCICDNFMTETPFVIISGGTDGVIYLFDINRKEICGTLVGHSQNVCHLQAFPGGKILSCSWDGTCKLWNGIQLVASLEGHEQAIWDSTLISDDIIITASADKTLRVWQNYQLKQILTGHTDVVRGVACLNDEDFCDLADLASVGNDGQLILWRINGHQVLSINAHDSFIYSIKVFGGHIFTAGEDRMIKVWKRSGGNLTCIQSIAVPTTSIWSLDVSDKGDIFCGCSDGRIYCFSPNLTPSSVSENLISEYKSRLNDSQVNSEVLDQSLETSDDSILKAPGKKVGQPILVKSDTGVVNVHIWDGNKWDKIGEVVQGPKPSKPQFDGKEYDYVFDVEVDSGLSLKLPYNIGENPFEAASRFISENELSMDLTSQVVEFIIKNAAQKLEKHQVKNELFNPYTTTLEPSRSQHKCFYKDANIEGIMKKLSDFGTQESPSMDQGIILELKPLLERGIGTDHSLKLLISCSQRWKFEHRFPLFDAIRVLLSREMKLQPQDLCNLLDAITSTKSHSGSLLTGCRLLCNLTFSLEHESFFLKFFDKILDFSYECSSVGLKDYSVFGSLIYRLIEIIPVERLIKLLPFVESTLRTNLDEKTLIIFLGCCQLLLPNLNSRQRSTLLGEIEILGGKSISPSVTAKIREIHNL